ncbi:MAG: hydroxymethylbilane synthase [Anaplasmataceae bacterium]|nr:hydroxymethylbilane synthase [Anaplasmataceae bacterium]
MKLGTRNSALALIQTEIFIKKLRLHYPDIKCEVVPIVTSGDIHKDKILAEIGGKGLFIKELDIALYNGDIDIAIHSLKDMPAILEDGIEIGLIVERDSPNDVFISYKYKTINEVPKNGIIGTSSPRRQAILKQKYSLNSQHIRGNITTRLEKAKNLDGIILGFAALKRLKLIDNNLFFYEIIDVNDMIPAVGQGAICVTYLQGNNKALDILKPMTDSDLQITIDAERIFMKAMSGDCFTPMSGYATINNDIINLKGMLSLNNKFYEKEIITNRVNYQEASKQLAKTLLNLIEI